MLTFEMCNFHDREMVVKVTKIILIIKNEHNDEVYI